MSFKIVDVVITNFKRIAKLNNEVEKLDEAKCWGLLFGYEDRDGDVYCTAIAKSLNQKSMQMIGLYDTRQGIEEDELVESAMNRIGKKNGLYYLLYFDTASQMRVCLIDLKKGSYEDCELVHVDLNDYLDKCTTVKLSANVVLKVIYDQDKEKYGENLKNEIDNVIKTLRRTPFKLINSDYTINFTSKETCCLSELYLHLKEDEISQLLAIQGSKAMKEKMKSELIKRWVNEKKELNFEFRDETLLQDHLEFYKFNQNDSVDMEIKFDFVFVLNHQTTTKLLGKLFENAFTRTLTELKVSLLNNHHLNKDEIKVAKPQFYNFSPFQYSASTFHLIYPKHSSDEELIEIRKKLCNNLNLPVDRPLIRKSNAIKSRSHYDSILSNVHTSLLTNARGTLGLINGTYSYFHYMQHNFNDTGWGCAYRSLQTLVSWFDHQGYINIDKIPSHRDIQQHLVEIGDKKPSFVNSKQWIGSQEVGYFLNKYGIQFKTMFVGNGAELANKGRELLDHFDKQGTPIMIGGGQLAHTILGVEYNEKTGDLKFLILDPHYTGGEDLKMILKQGWCGWKKTNFWSKDSHYNLCMPQRPDMI